MCYRITDEGADCLGSMVDLKEIDLRSCSRMKRARLEGSESLTYLTEPCLYHYPGFEDEGIVWIGKLVALRVLDFHGCCRLTLMSECFFLEPLVSVTKIGCL